MMYLSVSIKQQATLQSELSEMSLKLDQQKEQWEVAMKEVRGFPFHDILLKHHPAVGSHIPKGESCY